MSSRNGRDLNMEDHMFNDHFSGITLEPESLICRNEEMRAKHFVLGAATSKSTPIVSIFNGSINENLEQF